MASSATRRLSRLRFDQAGGMRASRSSIFPISMRPAALVSMRPLRRRMDFDSALTWPVKSSGPVMRKLCGAMISVSFSRSTRVPLSQPIQGDLSSKKKLKPPAMVPPYIFPPNEPLMPSRSNVAVIHESPPRNWRQRRFPIRTVPTTLLISFSGGYENWRLPGSVLISIW